MRDQPTPRTRGRRGLLTRIGLVCAIGFVAEGGSKGQTVPAPSQPTPSQIDAIHERLRDPDAGVIVVAHRGHHRDHPENSIGAIQAAIDIGAHIVEVDVHRTNDNRYVLMHDWNVGRTTTGWGEIDQFSFEQIRSLRLLHGIRVTRERVPTLEEAIETARGRVVLNLDLKDADALEVAAIAADLDAVDHCLFKFRWNDAGQAIAARLRRERPDIMIMPMVASVPELDAALQHFGNSAFMIEFMVLNGSQDHAQPEHVRRVHEAGGRAWVNALGDWNLDGLGDYAFPAIAAEAFIGLLDRGFNVIQTDLPDELIRVLQARSAIQEPILQQ